MQFTFDQIRKAERTLDRMANAALTLTDTDEQKKNIHAIQYLIGEIRMTAQALETADADKAQAVDRLLSVFANY